MLRRLSDTGSLPANAAREALESFPELAIERHAATRMLPRIWGLRQSFTAYDVAYVELTEALGLPLATTDARLGRSAQCHCAVITG